MIPEDTMRTYHASPSRTSYIASRTYICRRCGDAFARVSVAGNEFIPYGGLCETCPPLWGWLGGSVLDELRPEFNASLPHEAWLREVELHCRWVEKGEA